MEKKEGKKYQKPFWLKKKRKVKNLSCKNFLNFNTFYFSIFFSLDHEETTFLYDSLTITPFVRIKLALIQ